MPPHEPSEVPFTRPQLQRAYHAIGVAPGQTLMLHASVKAVGCVMGGPNVILSALLDTLTATGTLMMYAGWQDIPDFVQELPPEIAEVYREEHPAFDPAVSRAVREHGILAEFLRTWPGTQRSLNPEASMIANGPRAVWLTRDHPLNYGYGDGSPLAKLVELNGKVLMLGAPLDSMTLLHYAEFRARLRRKNVVHYQCPILDDGKKIWADVEDFDTPTLSIRLRRPMQERKVPVARRSGMPTPFCSTPPICAASPLFGWKSTLDSAYGETARLYFAISHGTAGLTAKSATGRGTNPLARGCAACGAGQMARIEPTN